MSWGQVLVLEGDRMYSFVITKLNNIHKETIYVVVTMCFESLMYSTKTIYVVRTMFSILIKVLIQVDFTIIIYNEIHVSFGLTDMNPIQLGWLKWLACLIH